MIKEFTINPTIAMWVSIALLFGATILHSLLVKYQMRISRTWIATAFPACLLTFMILCDGVYLDHYIISWVAGWAIIQSIVWTLTNSHLKNITLKHKDSELTITKAEKNNDENKASFNSK